MLRSPISTTLWGDDKSLTISTDSLSHVRLQLRDRVNWSRLVAVAAAAAPAAAAAEASLSFSSHGRVVKRCWSKLHVIFYCQPPQQIISLTRQKRSLLKHSHAYSHEHFYDDQSIGKPLLLRCWATGGRPVYSLLFRSGRLTDVEVDFSSLHRFRNNLTAKVLVRYCSLNFI